MKQQKHAEMTISNQSPAVVLPRGRKLPRGHAEKSQTALEQFFDAMQGDAAWCCYGAKETQKALELYIIDELFVIESGEVGGLSFDSWENLAVQHKVARLHRVSRSTANGQKFCKHIRIGGLLSRRFDCEDDPSPTYCGDRSPPSTRAPSDPLLDTISHTACAQNMYAVTANYSSNTAWNSFFKWLHGALHSELSDACDASALLDCVHVVLDDEQSEETWNQVLGNSSAMLQSDAPRCAGELSVRWHAAQFAETDAEHVAVVAGHISDLPAVAFFCAGHDCSDSAVTTPHECQSEDIPTPAEDMLSVVAGLIVAQLAHAPVFQRCRETVELRRAVTHPSYV
jgi:hypothetical protein